MQIMQIFPKLFIKSETPVLINIIYLFISPIFGIIVIENAIYTDNVGLVIIDGIRKQVDNYEALVKEQGEVTSFGGKKEMHFEGVNYLVWRKEQQSINIKK